VAQLAFIGVGVMGAGMAGNLLNAGHDLLIWNRSDSEAAAELVARGATRVATIEEALQAEVVCSMLATDQAMLDRFSPEVIASASLSTVHVSMATLSLEAVDELERRHQDAGIAFVSAPVFGRPNVAAAGQLNIALGGDPAVVERVSPLLQPMAKQLWNFGDRPRNANLVKIAVNYNLIHAIQALSESIALVERAGIDGQQLVDLLTSAAFTGSAYTGYGKLIASKDYAPLFPMPLGFKDFRLAESAAAEYDLVMPSTPVLRQQFEAALADDELKDLDWSALAELVRRSHAN